MSARELKVRLVGEMVSLGWRNDGGSIWDNYDLALQNVTERIIGVDNLDELRGRRSMDRNLVADAKSIQRFLEEEK